ncbi:Superoxide dismutase [Mn/Fe] [Frankliniella fusca]|uniref:Superoxide dismutase [Mn/Fe] n=1 Tax=Frankliniella fusca TaxID=407009 RepID=A0AAE1LWC6_9NEOP|nr:Superoxide dismutase [Mn/Fe] [Frankliniella fusca]
MGIFCETCGVTIQGGIPDYRKHLKDRIHRPPYRCFEGVCDGNTFSYVSTLLKHIGKQHPDAANASSGEDENVCENIVIESSEAHQNISYDEVSAEANCSEASHDDSGDDEDQSDNLSDINLSFERAVALLCMNLWRKGNVPGVAIGLVVEEMDKLLTDVTKAIKQEIEKNLRNFDVPEETITSAMMSVEVQSPTAHLKTKEKQMDYFEKHFGLIKPVSVFIRHRYDQRLHPTLTFQQDTQVPSTYQHISIIRTLTAVLNNPLLFKLIHEEKPSSDGHIRTFLDGSLAQQHPLIKKFPNILRLVFNGDEVDLVNKLGTKTVIHKLMGLYYLIQNLPPEENARLRSIHVAAYGFSADFDDREDVDTILGEICDELEKLQSEDGVLIAVNDRPFTLRAVVVALSADTEGAHKLLGLLPPGAKCFCRWCTVVRSDMYEDIFAMGEERTHELHKQHLEEVEARGQRACSNTGVKRDCKLRSVLKFSEFPQVGVFDSMHDILKGIAAMELKLTLHEFCTRKKFFTPHTLNARIKSFPYGPNDVKNKPSANFTDCSVSNQGYYALSQTAAQTWCLLRVFVFLVSCDVPHGNPHLRLISLLKRISEIVFSDDVTPENILLLEKLIHEHHQLFFELYPPNQENQVDHQDENDEEEEEVEDWNENFVDEPEEQHEQGNEDALQEEESGEPRNKRSRKKKKKIRPINKHHQILHYPSMIRKYGAAHLYWCMSMNSAVGQWFEGKHKIASQYARTTGNFINVASSVADIHQIAHAADLRETVCPVREELQTSKKFSKITVSSHPHVHLILALGLNRSTVVSLPKHAKMGGFYYSAGLYVIMPTRENDLPNFGLIQDLLVVDNSIILILQEQDTLNYNELFGAYACRPKSNGEVTIAIQTSSLPPRQSLSAWPRNDAPEHGLGGRHLRHLSSGNLDLNRFGLSLGDILDIEFALEVAKTNSELEASRNTEPSAQESSSKTVASQQLSSNSICKDITTVKSSRKAEASCSVVASQQLPSTSSCKDVTASKSSRKPGASCTVVASQQLSSTLTYKDFSTDRIVDYDSDSAFSTGTFKLGDQADSVHSDAEAGLGNTDFESNGFEPEKDTSNNSLLNGSENIVVGESTIGTATALSHERPGPSNSSDITHDDDLPIDLSEYVPEEQLRTLSEYEKLSIESKIRLYLSCKKQGLHFKLILPGITPNKALTKRSKPPSSKPLGDITNTNESELRRSSRLNNANTNSVQYDSNSSGSDQSTSARRKKKRSRTRNKSPERSATSQGSRATATVIPDFLCSFLEDPNLSENGKSLIKEYINDETVPNYDVKKILTKKRDIESALHQLNTKGYVFGTDLQMIVDELTNHLFSQVRKGLNIPAELKVGMAVSFVATYPKMCQALVAPDDKPWSWLFSRENNCGKLANNVASKQRHPNHPKARGGGLERRKNPKKKAEVELQPLTIQQLNLSNDAKYLKVLVANDRSRNTVESLARKTFDERRNIIKVKTAPLKLLLEAFPHITFFKGAMIDHEFDLLYPEKGEGFLKNFHLYVPKLLKIAELDEKKYPPGKCKVFADDDLNACIILANFLPKPKKSYSYEANMDPCPDISDFFQVVPVRDSVGSNLENEIARRCIERRHPIQPYLLCLGHPRCLGKITLVWGDKESTDLPVGIAPLKAVDYLAKAFHIMQVPYMLGWKNFFRFISYHFYRIPPEHNRLSVFTAQFVELSAVEL